jgi:3-oxoacyl-[acyl-carrier-protein] synthase-3
LIAAVSAPTAGISAIEYYLPEATLTNDSLSREHPEWSVAKIEAKTGIRQRHLAAAGETSLDLGVRAAEKLFASGAVAPAEIDFVLLCTQTPDYLLPTSACILQDRLGVPQAAGALDFNLGCSGFVYGLGLAKGLIESRQARNVLLVTAETYSKLLAPDDHSVRTIFGDAAAATLVREQPSDTAPMGPFVYGTDGSGARNLIVKSGGLREGGPIGTIAMNGPEIFHFTLQVVPQLIATTLERARLRREDIDLFVFHQANAFMLKHLRDKLEIPSERFALSLEDCGNTVSSTIPIVLKRCVGDGRLKAGQRVMLVGFGVGYSWGAAVVPWLMS